MRNVYLFQPQYSELVNDKWRYWLPYSCGCLWSAAQQHNKVTENWRLAEIIFRREPMDDVLDRLDDPAVCGFSCYLWNERYNLALAEQIRHRWPRCVIFFGGPQTNSEYLKYDFIDSLLFGEGEISFVELLHTLLEHRPLPKLWPKTRITDLSDLPPVYTSGVFDPIIQSHPEALFNVVLETNRGCPFSCTFCDWGGLTYSKVKKFNLEKIEDELHWMSRSRVASIFVADANFGIFSERDLEIARLIKHYADASQDLDYVNLTYTKNSNEHVYKIAQALAPYTKSVTLSMQSMNSDTLTAIKRSNMKINDLRDHIALSQKYDVATYTELILGMPEETKESWKTGLTDLLEAGQRNQIDVFFTLVLKNSELDQADYKRRYRLKSITVENYMVFGTDDEDESLKEKADLVCATRDMSTEDMIESYMYSWMITNFDIAGYSQIVSKFCRHVMDVSYRQFYDHLFDLLNDQDRCILPEFVEMKVNVTDLLTKGRMSNLDVGINHIAFYHYMPLYFKKDELVNLAIQAAESFGSISESFKDLQKAFVFDPSQPAQRSIQLSHDISDWQNRPTWYTVRHRVQNFKPTYYHLILQRKRGTMKNAIEKIPVHNEHKYLDHVVEML